MLGFQPVGDKRGREGARVPPCRGASSTRSSRVQCDRGSPATDAGADFAVEGRVADKDGRLHVTADVLDPHSHVLVYSFDTAVPDDPKADVAGEVAGHVALSLDPSKISYTLGGKLTAADYVLIARTNEAIDRGDWAANLDQIRKLADRHPEDGDLQASVGVPAIFEVERAGSPPASPPANQWPQLFQIAREAVARAERLNPNSAILYNLKALLVNGPSGYPERERLDRRSLSLNPDFHPTYIELGDLMLTVGRTEEGVALLKRAAQLDPMSAPVVATVTLKLYSAGRAEDAVQVLDQLNKIDPDIVHVAYARYALAFYADDPEQILALDSRYHLSVKFGGPRALMVEAARAHDPASVGRLADNCYSLFSRKAAQA